MRKPIQIAILGAGRWGVHLIRNFSTHPLSKVVAIADPDAERLKGVQERFQLPPDVILQTNPSALLELEGIDAVAIATPASTHYSLISTALKRGYHVFVEKPLTLNVTECWELCDLAEQENRQLFVDHTYLFHPAVERGKTVIEQGKIGELRYGYAARTHLEPVRQDVDALWDLAIHDIGIFNTWLEASPIEVQATGRVWLQPQTEHLDIKFQQGLSDLVLATLTYPSGFQAFLHLCWLNPDKQRRLAVVGTEGSLIFDELLTETPLVLQQGHLVQQGGGWKAANQQRQVIEVEPAEPLRTVCDRFLECVLNNTPSPVSSGWIGTEFVKILCALSDSLQNQGKPIQI